ncbi:MAG TPA: MFS transporter [Lacisediminihabitans sp.]|uniref:MFS transporter n=1 Tax=Lacisediminihabitans sp. TaxID=2787631 RepID=UPI002ED8CBEB
MTDGTAARSLWANGPFLRLWSGQTASAIGSQLSNLAIPVLAVSVLSASSFQVGLLGAVETAAFLVIGLPAGAWVDRWLKRRVMLFADLTRAIVLLAIPVLWFAGILNIWQLIVVAGLAGAATVFFEVAYQSYIPVLVPAGALAEANSRLETTQQLARVGGPAISGALLAVVRPAILIAGDALSYLLSFVVLSTIRDEEVRAARAERRPLVAEIREGMAFVLNEPLLRRIVLCTAVGNFFSTLTTTMLPVLVLRELHVGVAAWGVALSVGAVGGLLGALFSARIARRIGEGTVIPLSALGLGLGLLLLGLMPLAPHAAVPILVIAEFLVSFTVLIYNIAQVTFRQRICPRPLLGRMNASIRFVVWGVMPIAGIVSGLLSTAVGVVATVWIGGIGSTAACVFVLFSPLLGMRELPSEATVEPS